MAPHQEAARAQRLAFSFCMHFDAQSAETIHGVAEFLHSVQKYVSGHCKLIAVDADTSIR